MQKKIKSITFIALMGAFICVLAPFSIPIGVVPISLATFAIYIVASLLGGWKGFLATLVYICIGAIGIPVFSSFQGGMHIITGVTGGYILGYLPCALITGRLISFRKKHFWIYPVAMILGTMVCYMIGTIWYMGMTKSTLWSSLMICVVPFLLWDLVKIAFASSLTFLLHTRMNL